MAIDLNNSACIVERGWVSWGFDDYYDICHNIHHLVPWTTADKVVSATGLTVFTAAALFTLAALVHALRNL
ncbi:MAG: hypothetical protein KGO96_12350 [Elusimicrobia bacterium]|nr:hypothetical protein [Elusimicrobiota bacterium]